MNFESRTLNYSIDESKTTYRIALNLPLNHLGPLSTLRDKMDFISLEYFYKF
ncbi:MAG: hypothetical protein N3A69_06740 [Leptospiraceae bacterium]|nr:hypothetical protein [Leptospiraceae bacterium]